MPSSSMFKGFTLHRWSSSLDFSFISKIPHYIYKKGQRQLKYSGLHNYEEKILNCLSFFLSTIPDNPQGHRLSFMYHCTGILLLHLWERLSVNKHNLMYCPSLFHRWGQRLRMVPQHSCRCSIEQNNTASSSLLLHCWKYIFMLSEQEYRKVWTYP